MSVPDLARVSLVLERDGEVISGRLDDGDKTLPFRGWLVLAAAIERIRSTGSLTRHDDHDGDTDP